MKTHRAHISSLFSLLLLLAAGSMIAPPELQAQRNPAFYDYPYHHLDWYTIESDHFLVHFQEGNSRPAQVISRIAEEIHEPVTELYGHEPDHKVNIVLIDRLDYSNGAAFFYDNKIEIWLPSLDTPLRGTHNWLRNVITHEFTHIVQLQASMKQSRRHPASYLQWLSYEEVRRPDVLYGFPNGIISYPFSGISMPAWLAEGTAQYMREEIYYDDWDTHRDMLLRTRILDGTYHSLEKMGTFSSKTSLERELIYNQGFAFTRYLADRFGEQAIADITRAFSDSGVYDVRKAIKNATGIDGRDVFNDWIDALTDQYTRFAEGRETAPENRTWIEEDGFFNFHPAFSPDGDRIAYLSNKMTDGSMAALFLKDTESEDDPDEADYEARLFEDASLSHHASSGGRSHRNANALRWMSSGGSSGPTDDPANSSSRAGRIHEHGTSHAIQFESARLRRLETSFSYAPDGSQIAYSRARLNRYGEQYRDIYIYNLDESESTRLTYSERLQDPAWSPDGKVIAAGKIEDGSVNLYFYHPEHDSLTRITDFRHGEQIYRPVWHPDGDRLFIAYSDTAQRGIYEIRPANKQTREIDTNQSSPFPLRNGHHMQPVLTGSGVDFRDPAVSADGRWLYFSADSGGVFNIYRMSLNDQRVQQITNVTGGAFMPFPHPEKDQLLYSEFTSDGYKIALMDISETEFSYLDTGMTALENTPGGVAASRQASENTTEKRGNALAASEYALPHNRNNNPAKSEIYTLNYFDDSDIDPFTPDAVAHADTGVYSYQLPTRGSSSDRQFYSYEDQFTSFQFYPVVRFDNYSRLRGDNLSLLSNGQVGDLGQNLWRDFKVGTYVASREMRERFTIYGGALFGPGSRPSDGVSNFFTPGRLVNLDRDLFLEVEYAGLPFIKRHWSPTVSVSFFNIRRNVRDGLQIEEFPCTSCLPDTTSTDIAYNMWQAEVNLISKINRWSLVELGYYYSPYRVSTDSFFSREFQQEIPGSTSRYYIGSTWTGAWIFDLSLPDRHGDIAPLGWRGQIRYRYEPSELLDSYDIRDGTLIPVYNEFNNHSAEIDLRLGFDLMNQRFNVRSRFFGYLDSPDEFFYLDYIGGMIGMRSYPYFALGGTRTAFSQLSWFVPLKTDIYRQMGRFTLDKVFLRLFAEAGNGWGGPLNIDGTIKTGAGAELRVGMNSYYFFPTSFFISGAYGFDSFDLQLPDAFITETPSGRVTYGNRILINFGVLFDFEF